MHDDSPAGIACKDRTLAHWMDPRNFPTMPQRPRYKRSRNYRNAVRRGFVTAYVMQIGLGQ